MKKFFSFFAALLFAGSMMAEDATMTPGTNGSACTVNDVAGIKCGTSKAGGDMTITVGAGATKLTFYAAAWKGVTGLSLDLAADGVTISPASVSLTADDGISNNSPFTLAGLPENFKFEVDLTDVSAETVISVTSSAAKRFAVWGASYEAGGVTPPAVATPVIAGDEEFTDSVIVTITCSTTDADIYYTTDGTTDPKCDCAAAPEYTQEIVLKETTTIMAAAYTGNDWSAVATKTFTKKEPVVTSGIFKVEATTPVASGASLIDNALLTVNTAYASYVSGTSHTYSVAPEVSIEFPKAFQVRAASLPTAENLVGEDNNTTSTADKKKASPLVFVAKEDIEVAFYYRHQCPDTSNIAHQQNDNKDLKVFDQADVTAPMVTDRFIVADDGDKEYAFLAKAFSFQKGHTYTLTAVGTTLPLFGFDYALAEEEMAIYNVAEAIAAADAQDIKTDDSIVVRGVVTKLEFKGKNFAQYGSVNVYVADVTGAQGSFEFYNCYSLEADTFRTSSPAFDPTDKNYAYFTSVTDGNGNAIWVGDTVMAIGKYNKYNSTYQLNTGCHLTEIIAGPRVEPDPAVDPDPIEGAITVAKAIELVNAMGDGKTSTHEFTVEGYVVNAEEFSWASASQLFFLADDAANSGNQVFEAYYCYGLENGARIALINGDKVQLTGHLQKYVKDSVLPEISYAPAVVVEKATGDRPVKPEAQEITVAQALAIGANVADKQTTTEYYSITGYITKFIGSDGSFWMADAADGGSDKATAFEVYKGVSEATLQVGDKVNIFTRIKNYSQTIESETSVLVTVVEALKIDTINVAQAVDIALALEDNKETLKDYVILGYVANIKTAYDAEYKNISFYMSDDATATYGDLQVYRGSISAEEGATLAAGDRVMVIGKLKNNFYNDKNSAQTVQGSQVSVMWKQAIEHIVLTEKVNKVIMNGVLYIVRDGKLYNLQGAQVR